MEEKWKTLVLRGNTFDEYEISTHGTVKRVSSPNGRTKNGKVLKPSCYPNKRGQAYPQVVLSVNGNHTTCRIHRAVMETFVGSPNGREVNHIDGNKSNNFLDNLEYCDRKQNVRHAVDNRLMDRKGSKHPLAKLSEDQVIEIKRLLAAGNSNVSIAKQFGVSNQHIASIKLGKKWGHLALPI